MLPLPFLSLYTHEITLQLDKKLTSQDDEEEEDERVVAGRMHQMESSCGKLFQLLDRKALPKEVYCVLSNK